MGCVGGTIGGGCLWRSLPRHLCARIVKRWGTLPPRARTRLGGRGLSAGGRAGAGEPAGAAGGRGASSVGPRGQRDRRQRRQGPRGGARAERVSPCPARPAWFCSQLTRRWRRSSAAREGCAGGLEAEGRAAAARSLEALGLAGNALGDEGACLFADTLPRAHALRELGLGRNGVPPCPSHPYPPSTTRNVIYTDLLSPPPPYCCPYPCPYCTRHVT